MFEQFASTLTEFINNQHLDDLHIWTSLLKSTIQTVADLNVHKEHWKALNEIDGVRLICSCHLSLFHN